MDEFEDVISDRVVPRDHKLCAACGEVSFADSSVCYMCGETFEDAPETHTPHSRYYLEQGDKRFEIQLDAPIRFLVESVD